MKRTELKRKTPLKPGKPMARTSLRMKPDAATLAVKIRRKCCICKINPPANPMAKVCSTACAIQLAQEERQKRERREIKERRESMKTRSDWLREAQTAFNAFIRERDAPLPCISCGRHHQGAHDAGHYRSVGAMPALRFHEDNCHKQCVPCNQHKSGNILEYRLGLLARIGLERVAFLEGPHEATKYSIDDAKGIKALYKAKLKELKGRGQG